MFDGEDFFWEDLLDYVEERRVIPVVGPELLRATKNEALSRERDQKEWLVDSGSSKDVGPVTFLGAFSRGTRVLGITNPAGFCTELVRRWHERHPKTAVPAEACR